jgi:hypothetical protein
MFGLERLGVSIASGHLRMRPAAISGHPLPGKGLQSAGSRPSNRQERRLATDLDDVKRILADARDEDSRPLKEHPIPFEGNTFDDEADHARIG